MDKHAAVTAIGLGAVGASVVVAYALSSKQAALRESVSPPSIQPVLQPTPISQPSPALGTVEATLSPASNLPQYTPFPFDRLQNAAVPPNTIQTVFLGEIPSAYAAIIKYVGNTFPLALDSNGFSLVTLRWMVDGDLVERVQRIIADINAPNVLEPPLLATREIRWVCENRHPTQIANVNILQDGFMRLRKDR